MKLLKNPLKTFIVKPIVQELYLVKLEAETRGIWEKEAYYLRKVRSHAMINKDTYAQKYIIIRRLHKTESSDLPEDLKLK